MITTLAETSSMNTGPSFASAFIQGRFLQHASAHPERPCLEFNEAKTTYGEVALRSAAIARGLIDSGIRPGQVVAIIAERCDSLIWTLLGVLRAGAVFAVIDKAYPRKRIEAFLAIANPSAVIVCSLAPQENEPLSIHAPVFESAQLLAIGAASTSKADRSVAPKTIAYYLFTSGSTGKPKCVASNHAPLVNFVDWHIETFGLTGDDRFSMLSGLSHDPVLRDIFTPLSLGAVLAIPTQATILEIGSVRQFLFELQVTVVHLTPPLGQLILSGRANAPILARMRHFFWGGDKLPRAMVNAMRAIAPRAQHTNFYGATETPQAATYYRCPPILPVDGIPIGQGTRGFEIRIVDEHRHPVAKGEVGEIAIASSFLSIGYIEQGRIVDPTERDPATPAMRIYYTGDRGRVLPDGNVLVIGRSDDQIKIRGYRVELSEITAHLARHPQVASAIALPFGPEDARKVGGFVALKPSATIDAAGLIAHVAADLPAYMVPSEIFLFPDGLPLLPNGKIDRTGLIESANSRFSEKSEVSTEAINNPVLSGLIDGWAELFQRNDIDPESTFNGLGGDSLTYVGAYLVTEEWLGKVPDNWQTIPLRKLAESGKKKSHFFALVDSVIVMRALSMSMIVAFHADMTEWGDGATAALFIISGYLFGKTLFDALFDPKRIKNLLRPLRSLLPPTIAFAVLGTIYVYMRFRMVFPGSALLMADTIPDAHRAKVFESFFCWYLEALIKIIFAAFCLQWIAARCRIEKRGQMIFVATVAAILCLFRLNLPGLLHRIDPGIPRYDAYVINNFSFISNMGLFYLGIFLLWMQTTKQKIGMLLALALYAALCVPVFGAVPSIYLIVSAILIFFVPRIAIPRLVSRPTYEIAAASMYIYLAHWWLFKPVHEVGSVLHFKTSWIQWSELIVGILGGIALSNAVKFFQHHVHFRSTQRQFVEQAFEEVQ
jgi:amino acid adenylation domain-containing protein